MAQKMETVETIAGYNWSFSRDSDGSHSFDAVNTASNLMTAKRLSRVITLLESLCSKLDSLGADGIHTLIRIATKEHRKREQMRKVRAANKRRATMAKKRAQVAA